MTKKNQSKRPRTLMEAVVHAKPRPRKVKPIPSEMGWVIIVDGRISSGFIRTKAIAKKGNRLRDLFGKPRGQIMRAELRVVP